MASSILPRDDTGDTIEGAMYKVVFDNFKDKYTSDIHIVAHAKIYMEAVDYDFSRKVHLEFYPMVVNETYMSKSSFPTGTDSYDAIKEMVKQMYMSNANTSKFSITANITPISPMDYLESQNEAFGLVANEFRKNYDYIMTKIESMAMSDLVNRVSCPFVDMWYRTSNGNHPELIEYKLKQLGL